MFLLFVLFFLSFFQKGFILSIDVSSVVGAPWRCGVLTTQSGTAGVGLRHLLRRGHDSTRQSGVEAPRVSKRSLARLDCCCCCCCCLRRSLMWVYVHSTPAMQRQSLRRILPVTEHLGVRLPATQAPLQLLAVEGSKSPKTAGTQLREEESEKWRKNAEKTLSHRLNIAAKLCR